MGKDFSRGWFGRVSKYKPVLVNQSLRVKRLKDLSLTTQCEKPFQIYLSETSHKCAFRPKCMMGSTAVPPNIHFYFVCVNSLLHATVKMNTFNNDKAQSSDVSVSCRKAIWKHATCNRWASISVRLGIKCTMWPSGRRSLYCATCRILNLPLSPP